MVERIETLGDLSWRTSGGRVFRTQAEAIADEVNEILNADFYLAANGYLAEHFLLPYAKELLPLLQQYVEASDE